MVDLIVKTFPMSILAMYSVVGGCIVDHKNTPRCIEGFQSRGVKVLCIWVSLWVASRRFEEVEASLDNHKQAQRSFPEYFGEWFEPHLRARETVPPSTKPEP